MWPRSKLGAAGGAFHSKTFLQGRQPPRLHHIPCFHLFSYCLGTEGLPGEQQSTRFDDICSFKQQCLHFVQTDARFMSRSEFQPGGYFVPSWPLSVDSQPQKRQNVRGRSCLPRALWSVCRWQLPLWKVL